MPLAELMASPARHDLEWLKAALQAAVELEFFTIPPYLAAMWSIVEQEHEAAHVLRSVVYEEMEHMALACNMLLALGSSPRIADAEALPSYPRAMPGNVKPELIVALRPLTPEVIRDFMAIEAPEVVPEIPTARRPESLRKITEVFSRIGEFYDAIEAAFFDLKPRLSVDKQLAGPLAKLVVADLDDVRRAIDTIRTEGEGSRLQLVGQNGEIAHYYRFRQYHERRRLIPDTSSPVSFAWGEPLEFPEAFPMAPVPCGGYRYDVVPDDVAELLRDFDRTYSHVIDELQAAWTTPGHAGQAKLLRAIAEMFSLEAPARALMQMKIGAGEATYGPNFRYDPSPLPSRG